MKEFQKSNLKLTPLVPRDDARKHLEFGSDQGETMQGGAMGDHLYGMGGNDIIYVGAGGLFGREKCEAANDETTQVWRMAA